MVILGEREMQKEITFFPKPRVIPQAVLVYSERRQDPFLILAACGRRRYLYLYKYTEVDVVFYL